MKVKTKLLSSLAIIGLAVPTLGSIASCTFNTDPKPEEYKAPSAMYSGKRIFVTNEEQDGKYTISNFRLSRQLYTGERIIPILTNINQNEDTVEVVYDSISYDSSGSGFSLNIKMNIPSGEEKQAHIGKFNLAFKFSYNGDTSPTTELDGGNFTINYEAHQWKDNSITWSGDKNLDAIEEGTRVVNLWDGTTSFGFHLARPLDDGEHVTVQSSNQFIKVSLEELATTDIHVSFEVINHTWTKSETFDPINLTFFFTYNGNLMKKEVENEFSLKYHGIWQSNNASFIGESNQFVALRGKTEVESKWEIKLDRTLKDGESVDVKVLKKDGSEGSRISIKDGYQWYTGRLLNCIFVYTPSSKPEEDDLEFVLKLEFKDLAGSTRQTQILSADNTQYGRPFEFIYTAPWVENGITWNSSSDILDPGENTSSYQISGDGAEYIQLDRQVVVSNQESLKITIEGEDANAFEPLEEGVNWSYENVGSDYRIKINLVLKSDYADNSEHWYKFNLKFSFYENDILMQQPDEINNLQFHYHLSPTNEIIMPDHWDTKEKIFSFTASATEPIAPGDDLVKVEMIDGSTQHNISLNSWSLDSSRRTITFNMTITPANDYDDEDWTKIQFRATISGEHSYEMVTPDSFYIHYIHADNPYTEEDLAEYIRDRSFSVQIYNDKQPNYGYVEDATDWYEEEWEGSYLDDRDAQTVWILDDATLSDTDYTYYVITTYRFKQKMLEIYNDLRSSEKSKLKIQIGDQNGAHTYTSGSGKSDKKYFTFSKTQTNPTGLMLGSTTDYFNLTYGTDWIWQSDLATQKVGSRTIRSDMAVAKVKFDNICAQNSTYAKAIKGKLDKLNQWRKSDASKDPAGHHTINSILTERVGTNNRSKYKRFCSGGYPIDIYFNETSDSKCYPFTHDYTSDYYVPKIDAYKNNVHVAKSTLTSESTLWYSSTNVNDFGSFYDHTAQESYDNLYSTFGSDIDYYPNNTDWSKPTNEYGYNSRWDKYVDCAQISSNVYHACSSQYTPINGRRSSKRDGATSTYEPKLGYGARGSMAIIRKKDTTDPRIYVVATFTNIYEDGVDWGYYRPMFDGYLTDSNVNILANYIDNRQ